MSPVGSRRLKDRRCLGEGAEFPWPSPGLFYIPEFCGRLFNALIQQNFLKPENYPLSTLSEDEMLLHFAAKSASKRFTEATRSFQKIKEEIKHSLKLELIHSDSKLWAEIVREVESERMDPELHNVTQRVLMYIELKALASSQKKYCSSWGVVETVAEALEKLPPLPASIFLQAGERNPSYSGKAELSVHVPIVQDLWPIEQRICNALAKHLPVYFYRSQVAANHELNSNEGPQLQQLLSLAPETLPEKVDHTNFALAWAFTEDRPAPAETLTCAPGIFELDVLNKESLSYNFLLGSYARFLQTGSDFSEWKTEFRKIFPPKQENESLQSHLLNVLDSVDPEAFAPSVREKLLQLSDETALEWTLLCASDRRFTRAETTTNAHTETPHPRASSNGAPLYTLQDLAFSGAAHKVLWTSEKSFADIFNPQSSYNLKRSVLPQSFRRKLIERGFTIPDPISDCESLRGALWDLPRAIEVFHQASKTRAHTLREIAYQRSNPQWPELLSPSALETWSRCPTQYFLERFSKLKTHTEQDRLPIDPLNFGSWIHFVLEDVLKQSNLAQLRSTEELQQQLQTSLHLSIQKLFSENSSDDYLELLHKEARFLEGQLLRHIQQFEVPLLEIFGDPVRELESKTKAQIEDVNIAGRVDRVDFYPCEINLLWDYKTGSISDKTSKTLIRKNKFQWHLYAELLAAEGKPIAGGGYLNPLEASKSHLIAFAEKWDADKLKAFKQICRDTGHRLEIIKPPEKELCLSLLLEKIQTAEIEMKSGDLTPRGDITQDCPRCTVREICGKAFFYQEEQL